MVEETPSSRQLVALSLAIEGGMGLLALGLARWQGFALVSPNDWTWQSIVWGLAAALPLLLVFLAAVRLPLEPLQELLRVMDEQVIPIFRSCRLPELALISILAGWGEELLFRGVVQRSIGQWVGGWIGGTEGTWVGVVAAALLFGLLHPITKTYAALAVLIGLYLGWLLVATDNLLIPVTAHAVYDFLALLYLVQYRSRTHTPNPS